MFRFLRADALETRGWCCRMTAARRRDAGVAVVAMVGVDGEGAVGFEKWWSRRRKMVRTSGVRSQRSRSWSKVGRGRGSSSMPQRAAWVVSEVGVVGHGRCSWSVGLKRG